LNEKFFLDYCGTHSRWDNKPDVRKATLQRQEGVFMIYDLHESKLDANASLFTVGASNCNGL